MEPSVRVVNRVPVSGCPKREYKSKREYNTEYQRKRRANIPKKPRKKRDPIKLLNRQLAQYGITYEEFTAMAHKQNGACYICEKVPKRRLCVDHCHTTLRIRGLLCQRCNLAIAHFEDDLDRLARAITYLQNGASPLDAAL